MPEDAPSVRLILRRMAGVYSLELIAETLRDGLIAAGVNATIWMVPHESRGVWRRVANAWAARRTHRTFDHVLGDVQYLSFLLPRRGHVLTIHDAGHQPRAGLARRAYESLWFRGPLRRAGGVIAISSFTRDELVRRFGPIRAPITVIPDPLHPDFSPGPARVRDGDPEVLFVGSSPNKNLIRLCAAARGLPMRLHVVGHVAPVQRAALERSGVPFRVSSGLSRAAMVQAYRDALFVAFPSTYEGFGLPIVEAQAVGRPVLTSQLGPMPWVAGDAAEYVDPFDVASIRGGLVRLLDDADLRARLTASGIENAARFTPVAIGRAHAEFYRDVQAAG